MSKGAAPNFSERRYWVLRRITRLKVLCQKRSALKPPHVRTTAWDHHHHAHHPLAVSISVMAHETSREFVGAEGETLGGLLMRLAAKTAQ